MKAFRPQARKNRTADFSETPIRPRRPGAARGSQATGRTPLQAMIDDSPVVRAEAARIAGINNSPAQVAQRKLLAPNLGHPVQRQQGLEEEELLQGKAAPGTLQRKSLDDDDEMLQGRFDPVQQQGDMEEDDVLQGRFAGPDPAQRLQGDGDPEDNRTGMPDQLKTGMERLSGFDLSGVRVHYNSARPAQVNALAFTQGQDIHVAPGQERHLPHEAWHSVQQAEGRVKPTMQLNGGVPVDDDKGLEQEADVMGAKAVQMRLGGQVVGGAGGAARTLNSDASAALLPMSDHGFYTTIQCKLPDWAAMELLHYATRTYRLDLSSPDYRQVHRDLVMGHDTLGEAKAALDDHMQRTTGRTPPPPFEPTSVGVEQDEGPDAASAPTTSSLSSALSSAEDIRALQERAERLATKSENIGGGVAAATAAVALPDSTINYGSGISEVAAMLGVTKLDSRKPHTKKGTGRNKGGRDHQGADASAATRAREKVVDAIEDKTGVRMSPSEFIKMKEKDHLAQEQRGEKQAEKVRRQLDIAESEMKDYRNWIAFLAPKEWQEEQERLGNDYKKPIGKRSKLAAKADKQGWPKVWDSSLAADIQDF